MRLTHNLWRVSTYQALVSEAVKRYMNESPATQRLIAETIGITQAQVSKRLSGHVSWTLGDIEILHSVLGIEVPFPAIRKELAA